MRSRRGVPAVWLRASLLGVTACVAILGAGCSAGTTTPSGSPSTPADPSASVETGAPISASGTPTTPLANQVRTATKVIKPGVPEVAFGSVWFKTAPGDLVRLDPSTGKVEQTFPTDVPAASGCEGIGSTDTAIWVCRRPGTYVRLTPQGRTRTASFAGHPDQLRIPVMDDQLWLIGEDRTTLHSLDATSGKEIGAPIALPATSCDNVAAGLNAVWVACHDLGLVRVDPVSRDVTGTVPWPGGRYVAVDQHLLIGGDQGVAEVDPDTLGVRATYDLKPDYFGDLTTSGDHAWVGTSGTAPLTRLDLDTRTVGAVLTTDNPFEFVGVTLQGDVLWVSDIGDNAGRYRVLSVESTTPRP